MPAYPHLVEKPLYFAQARDSVAAMKALGVPYSDAEVEGAEALSRAQARRIAAQVVEEQGPAGMDDRKVIALVAYLMRIGTDLNKPIPEAAPAASTAEIARGADEVAAGAVAEVANQGGGR